MTCIKRMTWKWSSIRVFFCFLLLKWQLWEVSVSWAAGWSRWVSDGQKHMCQGTCLIVENPSPKKLVGGLEPFLFFHSVENVIIPIHELIFFRGVGFNHQPENGRTKSKFAWLRCVRTPYAAIQSLNAAKNGSTVYATGTGSNLHPSWVPLGWPAMFEIMKWWN